MESYDDLMAIFLGYFMLFCAVLIISMSIAIKFNESYAILFSVVSGLTILAYGLRNVR
jgi:hypothetical protein